MLVNPKPYKSDRLLHEIDRFTFRLDRLSDQSAKLMRDRALVNIRPNNKEFEQYGKSDKIRDLRKQSPILISSYLHHPQCDRGNDQRNDK
jgi:hypothetical protein